MCALYYTSQDLIRYQRIINHYAPIKTTLVFHDRYDNEPYYYINEQIAYIEISSFYSTFYSFPSIESRDAFHHAEIYRFIGKLHFSNYDYIEQLKKVIDDQLLILKKAYEDYWRDFKNVKQFKEAFMYYATLCQQFKLFEKIEVSGIENQIYLNYPIFSKDIFLSRAILADYDEYNININNKYDFIALIEKLGIFVSYEYKNINYKINHHQHILIKKLLLESRLKANSTKQRYEYTIEIINLFKNEMDEYNSKGFEQNYLDRTGYIYDLIFSKPKQKMIQKTKPNQIENLIQRQEILDRLDHLIDLENQASQKEIDEVSLEAVIQNPGKDAIEIKRISNQQIIDKPIPVLMNETKKQYIIEAKQNAYYVQKHIFHKKKTIYESKLDYGSKLEVKQLYRACIDGKVFRKVTHSKRNEIVVSILIDCSYSMEGLRKKQAIETAYKLGVLLQQLKISYTIQSHYVGDDKKTEIMEYISYQESRDIHYLDRLFHLQIKGYTQEYVALKQILFDLSKTKRDVQKGLVIVISDAETDFKEGIQKLCKQYRKTHHIDVLAIGVGTIEHVQAAYIHHLHLPSSKHFYQDLVAMFELLMI